MGSEIERRHLRAGFKLDWGELSRLERTVNHRGPWFRFADSVPLPRASSTQLKGFVCASMGIRQNRRHRQHQPRGRPGGKKRKMQPHSRKTVS